MIIVRLMGGLGNQMFQYAAGRSAAWKLKTELLLDTSYFSYVGDAKRSYRLDIFDISGKIIPTRKKRLLTANRWWWLRFGRPVRRINENIPVVKDNSYLDGHWQSCKYFDDIGNLIQKEFTFKTPPDRTNTLLLAKAAKTLSVAIHIRRGDYLDKSRNFFVLPKAYYSAAIGRIRMQVPNPVFFVFAETGIDLGWAKKSLPAGEKYIFVDSNCGDRNFEDLRIMSKCKHNIIANSTFSWWGAWLNKNKGKIVIAPKRWYKSGQVTNPDLILNSWITI